MRSHVPPHLNSHALASSRLLRAGVVRGWLEDGKGFIGAGLSSTVGLEPSTKRGPSTVRRMARRLHAVVHAESLSRLTRRFICYMEKIMKEIEFAASGLTPSMEYVHSWDGVSCIQSVMAAPTTMKTKRKVRMSSPRKKSGFDTSSQCMCVKRKKAS